MENIQKWKSYEEGFEGTYTIEDLHKIWNVEIDKNNFADFECWLMEMEKMQILIRLQEEINMNITQKQKEILSFINDNEKEIKELLNIASIKEVKNMGDTIEVAGITWRKSAEDEQGNHLMLADNIVCESKFGEDNNWKNSIIKTEILQDLYTKMAQEIGANNMVLFETDLFSHDGLRDYGKIEERISILTYDLYRNNRKNIKQIDKNYWLATPDSTSSGCGSDGVRCVYSDGDVFYDWCYGVGGVRPFFILQS